MFDNGRIISEMHICLHECAEALCSFLSLYLHRIRSDWWEECVYQKLTDNQKDIADQKGISKLEDFDLAALLRIAIGNWYNLRQFVYLPSFEKNTWFDLIRVRNNWAHSGTELPGKDAIVGDFEVVERFLTQRGASPNVLNKVRSIIVSIENVSAEEIAPVVETVPEKPSQNNSEAIKEKDMVLIQGQPGKSGVVISISEIAGSKKYEVFVDGGMRSFYEGQILPMPKAATEQWSNVDDFLAELTAYSINNPSSQNLYSLNAARIDFVPYQFRPALKLLKSDQPRILIADSVGVGKTIEAGLILKELSARKELKNVLIICPKPLVAERKWELEMKRFDEEFVPMDGPTLRQAIYDVNREGEWPYRYSRAIIPYSILDSKVYEGDSSNRGLKNLPIAPHFDLVIIDEAHHVRNGSMIKAKSFDYKCIKYFLENADAAVMLTATPLQTSDDDLFTLLNLLRPDVIIDKETFAMMSRPNPYVSEAIKALRTPSENSLEVARNALIEIKKTQWGESVIAKNPAYDAALALLSKASLSREERIGLISSIEGLHSFAFMLNRTRRRDIGDFCLRKPQTVSVDFTPRQKELYDALLEFEEKALTTIHGDPRSIAFMTSTIKRQAASCIFGLGPNIRDFIDRRYEALTTDNGEFIDEFVELGDVGELSVLSSRLLQLADDLPEEDPKFEAFYDLLQRKLQSEKNKAIVFSSFRHTLAYVRNKLVAKGIRVEQVDGSVNDAKRQELRARFELPKENNDAIDVLLFTEVGSEGLDYQFCDMLINYDLPWNPMRIEQRIGRIDRRGQQSEVVSIVNLVTEGTVDAEIYHRCLCRIGIFEHSVGETEEILGHITNQIRDIATDYHLSEEEKALRLERLADNDVLRMQEMQRLEEQQRQFFGLDVSEYLTTQAIKDSENPWLNSGLLESMIRLFLNKAIKKGEYILGSGSLKQLRLSKDAKKILRQSLIGLNLKKSIAKQEYEAFLCGEATMRPITFDPEEAERHHEAFFITPMHPLSIQAASYFRHEKTVHIKARYSEVGMRSGSYRFSIYAWRYTGLNEHTRLVAICEDEALSSSIAEILRVSSNIETSDGIDDSSWEELEAKQFALWRAEREKAIADARAVCAYRKESLRDSHNNLRLSLTRRIESVTDPAIIRMYQSQLENATIDFNSKTEAIDAALASSDVHSDLLANGIIEIVGD